MKKKYLCPACGSDEFITEPNCYDVMTFNKDSFTVTNTEYIDEYRVFCRGCSAEIDENESIKRGLIIIKK
jgi:chloramphenicol O-acetyltransferase